MRNRVTCLIVTLLVAIQANGAPSTAPTIEQPLKPQLKLTTLDAYEKAIEEKGVLLQGDHLWLFAPERKEKEAGVVFKYLTKAYDELYRIVGVHTKYKMIFYHLPKGWGGTSECVVEYDYSNLDFDNFSEWKKHRVPHMSGYIEEMAHNFVSTSKAQFGWEMIGWSLGVVVTQRTAGNPVFAKQVADTRKTQAETFARYKSLGFTFPPDIEANLCDRIHAHLLRQCEQKYGEKFWPDFFTEIRSRKQELADAVHKEGDDNIRNERYRITVECFDKLKGVGFKRVLEQNRISTTVDAKSLHPTGPGWDRKFVPR